MTPAPKHLLGGVYGYESGIPGGLSSARNENLLPVCIRGRHVTSKMTNPVVARRSDPIGHLYNLGLSLGSPWWPYGGRLSDPFSDFLPPTSALAKKKSVTSRWVIGPLNRRGSAQGLRNWSQIIFCDGHPAHIAPGEYPRGTVRA